MLVLVVVIVDVVGVVVVCVVVVMLCLFVVKMFFNVVLSVGFCSWLINVCVLFRWCVRVVCGKCGRFSISFL